MTAPDTRLLGPDDRDALSSFACARPREPWALEVQSAIRNDVADVLDLGDVNYGAAGLWEGGELVAVSTWDADRLDPETWWSSVLAVRHDRRCNGYGRRLKEELLERAGFEAEVRLVASRVRADNKPMLDLNASFRASIRRDPRNGLYRICTIRVG